MEYLNINNWKRKEHYEFFKDFDEPFFGIVTEIDCTTAYQYCKQNRISFFSYYLHKSLLAVNSVEEFRYRIVDNKIAIYDKIHAAVTIGRDDGTFAFTFVEFISNFNDFNKNLQSAIDKVRKSTGLYMYEDKTRKDVIHFSSTPWIKFTGLSHARKFDKENSTPIIVFGKTTKENDKMTMPIAVNVHHALMDALDVSIFNKSFEDFLRK